MSTQRESDSTAIITGASTGIGREFAKQLSGRCQRMWLVARNRERLEEVRQEVEAAGCSAEVWEADLADLSQIAALGEMVRNLDRVDYMINNAGFGSMGDYADLPLEVHRDMTTVHLQASFQLSHAVLPKMLARKSGRIVNVSSMSSFIIGPGQVTYAATKTALTSFSKSLQVELENTGVRVQALCPGFTRTNFHDRPAFEKFDRDTISRGMWLSTEYVVEYSLRKLDRGGVVCVPGWKNQLLSYLMMIPLVQRIAGKSVRKKPKD